MEEGNVSVGIEPFAETHYIKSFKKKYKNQWEVTLVAIQSQLEHIDRLLQTAKAEHICDVDNVRIIKTEFKIAGSKESAKTSGNRCIAAWYTDRKHVALLLVYGKADIPGRNETAQWKSMVRAAYPELRSIK